MMREAMAEILSLLREPGQLADDVPAGTSASTHLMATIGESLGDLVEAVSTVVPDSHAVRGSAGVGNRADVPWVAVFPPGGHTAQVGFYLVYLFRADGTGVYLSMNQGTERVRGGRNVLKKRALDLRAAAEPVDSDLLIDLDLRSTTERPIRYAAGSAFGVFYDAEALPSDEALQADLSRLFSLLERIEASDLTVDPSTEPVHLVLKWKADSKPQTVDIHRSIAEAQGSVWWGKFGTEGRAALASENLKEIRRQLMAVGVTTNVYLYRNGEVWRTTLQAITDDPVEVDVDLLPDYYSTDDCNLFVRISDFEKVDTGWLEDHLVLASSPDPGRTTGALGNQTSPLRMYQLFSPGDERAKSMISTEVPPATLSELANALLVDPMYLREIDQLLDDKRQIIFYGPPGTGKTYFAQAIAEYFARDGGDWRLVQFHPSYAYEDFVQGYRPVELSSGQPGFDLRPGPLLSIAAEAERDPDHRYVLVVDEINRGNIAKVFGELYYLLEYRSEGMTLQYQPDAEFALPDNLYLIGTMNTADRSIALIDAALRRRFYFYPFFPDEPPIEGLLGRWLAANRPEMVWVADIVDRANARLSADLDSRHSAIGPSHFLRRDLDDDWVRLIWKHSVLPYIEEQFFGEADVLDSFAFETLRSTGNPDSDSETDVGAEEQASPADSGSGDGEVAGGATTTD